MIQALILLATLAHGQASTDTVVAVDTQIEITGLGVDTRNLLRGRYVQTGRPNFKNGFCFGVQSSTDCMTTAASSSVAASTISCDGGGVLIASGSLTGGSDFQKTISVDFTSRTFHFDYVFLTTLAVNHVGMWFNNETAKRYSIATSLYDSGNPNQNRMLGSGTNNAFDIELGGSGVASDVANYGTNPMSGRCTFAATSSTTVQGRCESSYKAVGADAVCNTGTICSYNSAWRGELLAKPTRLDFCSNSLSVINGLPNCLQPMQSGRWKLCADSWRSE